MAVLGEGTHQKAELLKDVIYAANDGVITTFAVAAGVWGGGLSVLTVLILGFANLFADGFSMAISNYLGTKSEQEFLEASRPSEAGRKRPLRNSIVTFFSFTLAGAIPVLPFLGSFSGDRTFFYSAFLSLLAIFAIGALRTIFTKRHWLSSGLEMLFLGAFAALVAFGVGFLIRSLV